MVNLLATLSQRLHRTCTRTKFRGSRSGNGQIQQAMAQMMEMNSAFQETLSSWFEIVHAYRDLISNVERVSEHATSPARGANAELGPCMSDLAVALSGLAESARLRDTN